MEGGMKRFSVLVVVFVVAVLVSGAASPSMMPRSNGTVRLRFFSRWGVELPVFAVRGRMVTVGGTTTR
jgi:hypothetical protein